VSEELAFYKRFGNGGTVDRDERSLCTCTCIVDQPREEFFARPRFSLNQGARLARCYPAAKIHKLGHLLAFELDHIGSRRSCFELLAKNFIFFCQPAIAFDAADQDGKLLQVNGFGHVIPCPGLHGGNRRFDCAVGGQNNDFSIRVKPFRLLQHLQAVDARQSEIEQDQVESLEGEQAQGLLAVLGLFYAVSLVHQEISKYFPLIGLVFDN